MANSRELQIYIWVMSYTWKFISSGEVILSVGLSTETAKF